MKIFESVLKNDLNQFVDLKHKFGYKYRTGRGYLVHIDQFALMRGEISGGISKEFAEEYFKKRTDESDNCRYERVRHLAEFSNYLCGIGIPSHVPTLPGYKKRPFTPYIYSDEEITRILEAVDLLLLKKLGKATIAALMPMLVRLLIGTGLRIGEAIELRNDDFNLEDKFLVVRDSKNLRQRMVPLSNSLVSICKKYSDFKKFNEQVESEYFFSNEKGGLVCHGTILDHFRRCLESAGMHSTDSRSYRIHDLRHTFAVRVLEKMIKEGKDTYVTLPILKQLLGHRTLESTNQYVRYTTTMDEHLTNSLASIQSEIYSKF